MKSLPWHHRLEARVLLGVTLVVGVSLLAVLFFTRQAVTQSSLDRASQDLLAAREAFNSLVAGRAEFASRQTRLIAELPTFRSLLLDSAARADEETVNQTADHYCRKLEADFCVVTDAKGAWIGRANYTLTGPAPELSRGIAAARDGRPHTEVATLPDGLFLVVAQPATFDQGSTAEILGTFVVGYQLNHAVAAELALVAHCDVSFLCADGRVCGSSLPLGPRAILEGMFRTQRDPFGASTAGPALHTIGDTSFFGGVYPLTVAGAQTGSKADAAEREARLVLLQDWTPTERAVGRLHTRLLTVGSVTFLIALAGALVYSRLMTRPLRDLADVADEIASGNWSRRLPVEGSAEARTMAEAFNRMTVTLTHWHREATSRAEQLQESYDRFRAVTNSANDAIVSVDRRGEIVFWNLRA